MNQTYFGPTYVAPSDDPYVGPPDPCFGVGLIYRRCVGCGRLMAHYVDFVPTCSDCRDQLAAS
jgi:hypothetical protein